MENRKTIFLWGGGKIKIESKRNTKPNKRYIKKNQTIAQKGRNKEISICYKKKRKRYIKLLLK